MKVFAEIGYSIIGIGGAIFGIVVLFLIMTLFVNAFTGKDDLEYEIQHLRLQKRSWEYCLSDASRYDTIKECWENRPKTL